MFLSHIASLEGELYNELMEVDVEKHILKALCMHTMCLAKISIDCEQFLRCNLSGVTSGYFTVSHCMGNF